MAIEAARGCGYRKVGGLYLVGGGSHVSCDRLPYEIVNCPTCGSGIKFSRGFTWIDWYKYAGVHNDNCRCSIACPVCHPEMNRPLVATYPNFEEWKSYALLWIGERFYTPEEFVRESVQMGISRRLPTPAGKVPRGPKGLKLGETWVLCAHIKACGEGKDPETGLPVNRPGVFYVFRPTALEYLVWEGEATKERIEELVKAGITPVVIPDGDVDHNPDTPLGLSDVDKEAHSDKLLFADLRSKLRRYHNANSMQDMHHD